jgi:alpha-1,3-rhamnosyl/mannosyltransferase
MVLRFNRRAGLIIVPSQVYANQLIQYYGYRLDQMRAIHHGTSARFIPQPLEAISETRKKWGIEDGAILSVTNTLPHKNLRCLLRAFEQLRLHYGLERQLVLVGNIKSDVLEALLQSVTADPSALRARIRVLPFMPHDQLPPIYGTAGLFVFVSLTETFGMPLTEAMACGVPIIASDLPVHEEILEGTGLLVQPLSAESIAQAMHLVLTDESVRHRLREASLKRAPAFSWIETAKQTIAVYEEAACSSKGNV